MGYKTNDHAFSAKDDRSHSEPTYAGALSFMRRRFTKNVSGADVVIMGVPFDAAVSNRPGSRFGPQAIRRASAIFDNDEQYPFHADIFRHLNVVDFGDLLWDYGYPQQIYGLIEKQAAKIIKGGQTLITLGGDHSITYGLLKAHAAKHGPVAIIHFDAHQDTWPDDGKRIDHGSFVLRATREGLIDTDHSIQIGIRTHAPEPCGIKILYGYDVEAMSAVEIAEVIYARVGGAKTYITFDIDCLDPAYAPGTGTPVSGGPSSAKMLSVLRHLKNIQMVGADIVEVAPAYDHADITAIAGATVAQHYLGLLAERRRAELTK
jgi:agmatinase